MKSITIIVLIIALGGVAAAQNLTDLYGSGTVTLIPDPEYGSGNNWEELFGDYDKKAYNNPVGTYRSLAVVGDGSVFVSNYSSYSLYKFDSRGRFVREWGSEGWGDGQFVNRPILGGVLDDQYVVTREHNGRVNLFDLDGNFVRRLQLDYMPLKVVALRDSRIAVLGHTSWGSKGQRRFVAIINVETLDEEIVFSRFGSGFEGCIVVQKDSMTMSIANPTAKVTEFIAATTDGNLVVGQSDSSEVRVFSPYGDLLHTVDLTITPLPVTEEIRSEYIAGVEKSVEKGLPEEALDQVRQADFFPEKLPYYYNLLVDSDNNILIFVYTEVDSERRFQVYTFEPTGRLVAETEIVSNEYELSFVPRFNRLVFHGDDIYGILPLKETAGTPLRLLKMKLAGK